MVEHLFFDGHLTNILSLLEKSNILSLFPHLIVAFADPSDSWISIGWFKL